MPPARRLRSSRRPLAVTALLWAGLAGCTAQSTPQEVAPAAAPPEAVTPAEPTTAAEPEAKKPPPLSEEDLALIAADPEDLTPEMRRKRAYARRRQIMQDPDSPAARALSDLAEAHRAGDIDVQRRDGVWFSLPGTKPTGGRPPAGWRPPEGDAESGEGGADQTPPEQPPTSPTPSSP